MSSNFSADKMKNAGDVIIDDIRLVSYTGFEVNLRKLMASIEIYESVYSNGISGSILLSESLNLARSVPIIGQEEIFFTFRTPGISNSSRTLRAKVFKVSSHLQGDAGRGVNVLKLEFVSPIVTLSNSVKMNRSIKSKSYSTMVSSIYNDLKKIDLNLPELYVEPTAGSTTLIIPNWSPLYAINWMSYRSTSSIDNMASDYFFYQTLDGFFFRSLSSLKKVPADITYKNIPAGFRDKRFKERMIESDLRNIIEHSIADVSDKLKETATGLYGSKLLVHEMVTKSYYTQYHSYRDTFRISPHLNEHPIIDRANDLQDSPTSYLKYHIKSHYNYDSIDDANFIDKSLLRQMQINELNSFIMTMKVFGDSTLRPGNVINIELDSSENRMKSNERTDRYLSGKYMITTIRHEIKEGIHEMDVTVSRDSYSAPLPDKKDKEVKFDP